MSVSAGIDDSFEAYAADDHRFIALVVSSDDDDSVSYSSSISVGTTAGDVAQYPAVAAPVATPAAPSVSVSVVTTVANHQRKVSAASSSATRKSQERKNSEKKRWSLISNHSHSSSSKKRWSMLSSFTTDSIAKEGQQAQRVTSTSAASQHSGKTSHDLSLDNIPNSSNSRSSSMKRSSTGASLRQLFNKISISDKEVPSANKENIPVIRVPEPKQNSKSIIIPSAKARTASTSSSSSAFRAPLKPVNVQTSTNHHNQPHNSQLRNRRSMQFSSHRNSIYSQSTTATNTTATSGSASSLSGKWKFWKKSSSPSSSSSELPKSISTQSLNVNMISGHSSETINHRRKASIASSKGPNSPTSSIPTIRNRTSFSDFHKSLFSNENSISTANTSTGGERRMSINNKRSSSSLSISLKHKTSYSSLKKFKSRRKSNTTNDDGSSFVSSGSGSNNNMANVNRTNSNNIISLPIPDEVSREKIRAKLRNSTSLLSLNSTMPISKRDFDENILNQVLNLTSIKYILTDIDLKHTDNSDLEVLSSNTSLKLTDNVWRMISTRDPSETVICKKLSLDSNSKALSLNELQILKLVRGTPGLPALTQSYVHKASSGSEDQKLNLFLFFKDHGSSLEHTTIHSWSQCLNIFWQCVNIMYVTETKFKFEHRNLTLDHVLVDNNGNVTLCDMDTCRAQTGSAQDAQVFYKRLDHPIFYQNKKEFSFDIYQSMRQYFNGESSWTNFEPRTNLLWLHYLAIMLLKKNTNGKFMGPGRDQLHKIATLLEYNTVPSSRRNSIFKRKENEIRSTGDLMKFK
ncbi:protein kinase [Maudiozyma humilis]|uniref:non-specific serine/threonine protein kinase n=1 Tax=Maudiozyma humilis TaxID=51915 RepID=A0AAV5RYN9_MAUHU|nr:protein kinase [Kazachstania humilis]